MKCTWNSACHTVHELLSSSCRRVQSGTGEAAIARGQSWQRRMLFLQWQRGKEIACLPGRVWQNGSQDTKILQGGKASGRIRGGGAWSAHTGGGLPGGKVLSERLAVGRQAAVRGDRTRGNQLCINTRNLVQMAFEASKTDSRKLPFLHFYNTCSSHKNWASIIIRKSWHWKSCWTI